MYLVGLTDLQLPFLAAYRTIKAALCPVEQLIWEICQCPFLQHGEWSSPPNQGLECFCNTSPFWGLLTPLHDLISLQLSKWSSLAVRSTFSLRGVWPQWVVMLIWHRCHDSQPQQLHLVMLLFGGANCRASYLRTTELTITSRTSGSSLP